MLCNSSRQVGRYLVTALSWRPTAALHSQQRRPFAALVQRCWPASTLSIVLWPLRSCVDCNPISKFYSMAAKRDHANIETIYEFTMKDTFGNDVSLEKYKGQVVLIVNIASQCGLTATNYKELTELKEMFKDSPFKILNFPCNQFSSQMPEKDGEDMVCHLRDRKADIGDVFQKIDVNGDAADPLYKFLKAKQPGTLGNDIKWNFSKFLIDKKGVPVKRYAPTTKPLQIVPDIKKYLDEP